jgi:hypothetical protein
MLPAVAMDMCEVTVVALTPVVKADPDAAKAGHVTAAVGRLLRQLSPARRRQAVRIWLFMLAGALAEMLSFRS